jgi:hypothetical protein
MSILWITFIFKAFKTLNDVVFKTKGMKFTRVINRKTSSLIINFVTTAQGL